MCVGVQRVSFWGDEVLGYNKNTSAALEENTVMLELF